MNDPSIRVPIAFVAAVAGVTPTWIRELAARGFGPRPERGKVPLDAAIKGYVASLKSDARDAGASAATGRAQDARAQLLALRLAEEQRRVIDIEEHESVLDEVLGIVIVAMSGVGAKVTRDIPLRDKIDDAIRAGLNEAADRCAARCGELRAGGEGAAPAKAAPKKKVRSR